MVSTWQKRGTKWFGTEQRGLAELEVGIAGFPFRLRSLAYCAPFDIKAGQLRWSLRLERVAHIGSDTDSSLIAAAAAGDRNAFALLLERHYDRIHGLAWQLTGSRADADDIAQDVCCTLVEKLHGYRGEAKFTTWLHGITFNACRDLRRRRRSFGAFTDRLAVLVGLAEAQDGRDLYDAIWLKSAIARLKPALRDTAVLVAGQQLTHAEAAAILGISEATVSWRMHEVRRILASGK